MTSCCDDICQKPFRKNSEQTVGYHTMLLRVCALYSMVGDSSNVLELCPTRKKNWQFSFLLYEIYVYFFLSSDMSLQAYYIFVPRLNEVEEGGYCIAHHPSFRPYDSNNFKTLGLNLTWVTPLGQDYCIGRPKNRRKTRRGTLSFTRMHFYIFFFPTSQEHPCRDPSTVKYKAI